MQAAIKITSSVMSTSASDKLAKLYFKLSSHVPTRNSLAKCFKLKSSKRVCLVRRESSTRFAALSLSSTIELLE